MEVVASTDPSPLTEVGTLKAADDAAVLPSAEKAAMHQTVAVVEQIKKDVYKKMDDLKSSLTRMQNETNTTALAANTNTALSVSNVGTVPVASTILPASIVNYGTSKTAKQRFNALKYRVNDFSVGTIDKQQDGTKQDIYVANEVKKATAS
jgi:hypothetical protein